MASFMKQTGKMPFFAKRKNRARSAATQGAKNAKNRDLKVSTYEGSKGNV